MKLKNALLAVLLLFSLHSISQRRVGIQDYADAAALQAETLLPKENDKVYVKSVKKLFSWDASSTAATDFLTIIQQNNVAVGRWRLVGSDAFLDNTQTWTGINTFQDRTTFGGRVGLGGITTPNADLHFPNVLQNRRAVLWEVTNNDHEFYGFGINSAMMRYQVGSVGADHVFYAGYDATSSLELMRLTSAGGFGRLGINVQNPAEPLHVRGNGIFEGAMAAYKNGSGSISNHLYFANEANNRAYNWQLNADGSAADFWGFAGSWNRLMTIGANGNVGVNPLLKLDVNGGIRAYNNSFVADARTDYAGYQWYNEGSPRWWMYNQGDATDDLMLARYNDSGGYVDNPLIIKRSTGNMLVAGTVDSGEKFQVTGAAKVSDYLKVHTNLRLWNGAGGAANSIGLGEYTLANNTSGNANIALGQYTLANNTTGTANIGLGSSILYNNLDGSHNVGIGASALYNNISGSANVGIGSYALLSAKGSWNTAVGYNAFVNLTTGFGNVGLGINTGELVTTGINNVFVGNNTGEDVTTGSGNVILGGYSGARIADQNSWVIIADGYGNERMSVSPNGNTLVGTTVDNGLAKLQTPSISLGTNQWHHSSDGHQRIFYLNNGNSYFSTPENTYQLFRFGALESYLIGKDNLFQYSDNISNFTQKKFGASSPTNREWIHRKEASGTDYRFFDWNGTSARDWWNVNAYSEKMTLGQSMYINYGGGNVGVGVSNPSFKFEVSGTVGIRDGLGVQVFRDGSNSIANHLYFANAANNRAYNWQLNADGSAATFWGFREGIGWGQIAAFRADGKFLIGSTVDSGENLQVTGTSKFSSSVNIAANGLKMQGSQTLLYSGGMLYHYALGSGHVFTRGEGDITLFEIKSDGRLILQNTVTPTGTNGAQTINKPSGTVNMAAGQNTLVVTNNTVSTNSLVFATIRTNDNTAQIKNVVPSAGSFTIRLTANATAATSIGFFVVNY